MRKYVYPVLTLLIALSLRLYPTIISGQPFSNDAWSPIRNAELLMEHTPVHLSDDKVFDGYNCYWPANSLFGVVLSHVTGLKPVDAMAIGIPLTGTLTTLIFYVLVRRVSGNPKIAFFASILLATAYPYAFFTAGVTKETYANPLYVLSILIFLSASTWRKVVMFMITSISLVLAHHLTALVTIAVLASITLANSIIRVRRGLKPDRLEFLLVSILTVATALYLGLYAYRGLKLTFTLSDWLSVASYQAVALALALYLALKPSNPSSTRTFLMCSASAAIVSLFALFCTERSIIPDAPILPSHYMLYATPFILASPLIVLGLVVLGLAVLGLAVLGEHYMTPLFWLATILGLEGYAVFGNSVFGLTLAYRGVNFLWPPLAALCAVGLHRLYITARKSHSRRLAKLAAVAALLAIASLNSYSVYAAVSLEERYMGYFWLYKNHEYKAGAWITATNNNQTVAGDVKVFYLLNGYFNVKVDVLQGLRYLTGENGSKPQILFIYDQMLRNGYVLYSGYSVDLPENWTGKASQLNLIYSNGLASLYAR